MVEVEVTEIVQGQTMLCGLLHKVTDRMGGVGESLYYHLAPSVKALETTAAGKLLLASTAIRANIPQMIGKASEAIAPYSNPVYDTTAGAVKYVAGKGLKSVAKVVAGDSTIYETAKEAAGDIQSKMYNYAAGAAASASASAQEQGAETAKNFTEAATQAYNHINSGLTTLQESATNMMSQGAETAQDYVTEGMESGLKMVETNVENLIKMGDGIKGHAYNRVNEGINTVQEGFTNLMENGAENASKGIAHGIKMIQENSASLRDQAIAFVKENQTTISVIGGAAALAAVGYLSYTAYNEYVVNNEEHKIEDDKKSMAAKVSKEFTQLKNSRIKTMNAEKDNITDKFQELQGFLKDTNDLSMIRLSKDMVYKYKKDQTVDPEDVKKLREMAVDRVQGANLSADKMAKLQETSAELMASVMMCDQITKDLSQGRVSPSFVRKVVADRAGNSQKTRSE